MRTAALSFLILGLAASTGAQVGDGADVGHDRDLQPSQGSLIDWDELLREAGPEWSPLPQPEDQRPATEGGILLEAEIGLAEIPADFVPAGMVAFSSLAFRNLPELGRRARQGFEILAFCLILGGMIGGLRQVQEGRDLLAAILRPLLAVALIALLPALMNQMLRLCDLMAAGIFDSLAGDNSSLGPPPETEGILYSGSRLGAQIFYIAESLRLSPEGEDNALAQDFFQAALRLPANGSFGVEHLFQMLTRHTRLSREGIGNLVQQYQQLGTEDRDELARDIRDAHERFVERDGGSGTSLGRLFTRRAADYAKEVEAAFQKRGIAFASLGLLQKMIGLSVEDLIQNLLGRVLQLLFTACLWIGACLLFLAETARFILIHLGMILAPLAAGAIATRSFRNQGMVYLMGLLAVVAWPIFWAVGHIGTVVIFDAVLQSMSQMVNLSAEGLLRELTGDNVFLQFGVSSLKSVLPAVMLKAGTGILVGLVLLGIALLVWVLAVTLLTPFISHKILAQGASWVESLGGAAHALASSGISSPAAGTVLGGGVAAAGGSAVGRSLPESPGRIAPTAGIELSARTSSSRQAALKSMGQASG